MYALCLPLDSADVREQYINMMVTAFPNSQLLINDGAFDEVLQYGLQQQTNVGMVGLRRDNFADSEFMDALNWTPYAPVMLTVWPKAPVVVEPFGSTSNLSMSIQDVTYFHVSNIGNGNLLPWNQYSQSEQNNLLTAATLAGYRIVLNSVTFPTTINTNSLFTVSSQWTNVGIAPIYEKWNVTWNLLNSNNQPVWSAVSNLQLRLFQPSNSSTNIQDTNLRVSVTAGSYNFAVQVLDPAGIRAPLSLAIEGRDNDGFYPLSTITVQG